MVLIFHKESNEAEKNGWRQPLWSGYCIIEHAKFIVKQKEFLYPLTIVISTNYIHTSRIFFQLSNLKLIDMLKVWDKVELNVI